MELRLSVCGSDDEGQRLGGMAVFGGGSADNVVVVASNGVTVILELAVVKALGPKIFRRRF